MKFQIWENEFDGSIELTRADSVNYKQLLMEYVGYKLGFLEEKVELLAEFEANTMLEAAEKRNEIMSWEPYEPMRDPKGDIYPEYLVPLDKKTK